MPRPLSGYGCLISRAGESGEICQHATRVARGGWRRCIGRAPGVPLLANGLFAPDVERLGRRSGDAHREIHETGLATLGDRHARPKRAGSLGGGQAYAGRTAEDRDGLAGKRRNAHLQQMDCARARRSWSSGHRAASGGHQQQRAPNRPGARHASDFSKAPLSGPRARVTNAVPETAHLRDPDDVTADCPIDILNIVIQKLKQLQREEP